MCVIHILLFGSKFYILAMYCKCLIYIQNIEKSDFFNIFDIVNPVFYGWQSRCIVTVLK